MRNIEFKCRLADRDRALRLCRELGARWGSELEQRDTYYRTVRGRLKRRECPGEPTCWIEYDRADEPDQRPSDYAIYTPGEAAQRFELANLVAWVVVRKRRTLLMHGEVRIHLDQVHGLGAFLELESLVNERQSELEAERALTRLRSALAPVLGPATSESYSDLVAASTSSAARVPATAAPSRCGATR